MKKMLSLFLALVMALSLCTTAFAGNTAGTSVIRLTGDAADQVVDLKNGQRLSADSSTLVRLNVLDDPSAEEYTVTLDGEKLEPDHSTSQYHFYAVPAAQASGVATLSVNSGVSTQADETGATVTIKVGNYSQDIILTADKGGTTSAPDLEDVTLPSYDGSFQRIYINVPEGVTVGTDAKRAGRNFKLIGNESFVQVEGKGKTTADLYFYNTPNSSERTRSVAFSYDIGDTTYYYKLNIVCQAVPKYALGEGGFNNDGAIYSEVTPGGTATTNSFSYSGGEYTVTANWKSEAMLSMSQIYDAMCVYSNGTKIDVDQNTLTPLAEVDWDTLTAASNGLYTTAPSGFMTMLSVARPGSYWFPVSLTYEGQELTGMLPMEARATATVASDYLNAANAVKDSVANEGTKALLNSAIETVTNAQEHLASTVYVDGSRYTYTAPDDSKLAAVNTARTYYGAPITGAALVEKELNILQDVTALWNKDDEQRDNRLAAYMSIMNMTDGVHAAIDIKSDTGRDLYQQIRQAKWDLLQATDLDGINKVLTDLRLPEISDAPEVMLGDINNDGTAGDMRDVILIIKYYNQLLTETDVFNEKAADVNCDGTVDMKDVIEMIKVYNQLATDYSGAAKKDGGNA